METVCDKIKKTRECGFINILDPKTKNEIVSIVNPPSDATNFIFWFSKVTQDWGLTIKSIPSLDDKEGFPSQHTWKITWCFKNNVLSVANHCKSLAQDITGVAFDQIKVLYDAYKKK